MLKACQLKIILKKTKPPVWKRCIVPVGITFSQLAVILEEVMEEEPSDRYEYEFYQAKIHLREWREGAEPLTKWNYNYMCSSDTFIDGLLGREDWFTFRRNDGVDLRVEIEKRLDEENPCPCVLKQNGTPQNGAWTDAEALNRRLEERLTVTWGKADHSGYEKLRSRLEQGNTGLKGAAQPVDRQGRYRKSANTIIKDFSESLQSALAEKILGELRDLCKAKAGEEESRDPSFEEFFSDWSLKELQEMAADLKLPGYRALKKAGLIQAIREELLKPEVMESRLLLLSDAEAAAFERALKKEHGYYPAPDELEDLDRLYQLAYLIIYEDDYVQVLPEVARVYEGINTPEYQKRRREAFWMYHCLLFVGLLYAAAPERIVRRMLKNCLGYPVAREAFPEIFDLVPQELNPCVRREGRVIHKETLPDDLYRDIERTQGEIEFYIPSPEEVLDYTENGYPTGDPQYESLRSFLTGQLGVGEETADGLIPAIWNRISMGGQLSDVMELLEDAGIIFPSEQVWKESVPLIMDLSNHTRMLVGRGWTPMEMLERMPAQQGGKLPTIVPMSTMAADMLRESADELSSLGFGVDPDYGADEIPMVYMPQGTSGSMEAGSRKVYPNDPCPCGSGKKYKKCCGRNR